MESYEQLLASLSNPSHLNMLSPVPDINMQRHSRRPHIYHRPSISHVLCLSWMLLLAALLIPLLSWTTQSLLTSIQQHPCVQLCVSRILLPCVCQHLSSCAAAAVYHPSSILDIDFYFSQVMGPTISMIHTIEEY
jgi:hypothetical protein